MNSIQPKPRVLLVEDYDDAREMYVEYLTLCGFEMAEAAIGRYLHEEDANALHERYENRMQALIASKSGGAMLPEAEPGLAAALPLAAQAEAPHPDIESEAEAHADAAVADPLPRWPWTPRVLLCWVSIWPARLPKRFDWAGCCDSQRPTSRSQILDLGNWELEIGSWILGVDGSTCEEPPDHLTESHRATR